jgi:rhodanese-related sulfurtransferase
MNQLSLTLRQLAQDIAARPQQWAGLVRYDASERWYRRLSHDHDQEVWLLSWLPGQDTGFHDHGESAGAFAVAFGALRESTLSPQRAGVALRSAFGRQAPGVASYDTHVIIMCVEGYASSLAAASLQDLGLVRATDLAGGFLAWARAGLPVV